MKLTIKSRGYKNEGLSEILEYIEKNTNKDVLIRIDEDDFINSVDLFFDNLKISSYKFKELRDGEYLNTLNCSYKVAQNLLKLFLNLKKFGDCGHSFTVKINDKGFSWDGDGSDRITEINGFNCESWKDLEENFYKINNIEESLNKEYFIENLNKLYY